MADRARRKRLNLAPPRWKVADRGWRGGVVVEVDGGGGFRPRGARGDRTPRRGAPGARTRKGSSPPGSARRPRRGGGWATTRAGRPSAAASPARSAAAAKPRGRPRPPDPARTATSGRPRRGGDEQHLRGRPETALYGDFASGARIVPGPRARNGRGRAGPPRRGSWRADWGRRGRHAERARRARRWRAGVRGATECG